MDAFDVYTAYEDALYQLIIRKFPDWRVIFQGQGGPEPQMPYVSIKSSRLDPIGMPVITSAREDIDYFYETYEQTYYANTMFEVIGTAQQNNDAARMCFALMNYIRTESLENRSDLDLSLYRVSPMFSVERQRELDTVVYHQLSIRFGFTTQTSIETPIISVVEGEAVINGSEVSRTISFEVDEHKIINIIGD